LPVIRGCGQARRFVSRAPRACPAYRAKTEQNRVPPYCARTTTVAVARFMLLRAQIQITASSQLGGLPLTVFELRVDPPALLGGVVHCSPQLRLEAGNDERRSPPQWNVVFVRILFRATTSETCISRCNLCIKRGSSSPTCPPSPLHVHGLRRSSGRFGVVCVFLVGERLVRPPGYKTGTT
jgi:hypothetical protein